MNPVSPLTDWSRLCAAVIPCLNEAASIAEVVRGVHRHLPSVIVVDDGSTDGTAAQATAAGAEVLRHAANQGKGAALQTGWRRAREQGFTWALTLDGDGQHAPGDIPTFFARAEKTGARLVVGSRLDRAEAMPRVRHWVNRWMTRHLSLLAGASFADSQCGFRLVHLDSWSGVSLTATHFEIESDLLLAFVAAGYLVEFVPVQVIYKVRPSKVHPLVDAGRWLRWRLGVGMAAANRPKLTRLPDPSRISDSSEPTAKHAKLAD